MDFPRKVILDNPEAADGAAAERFHKLIQKHYKGLRAELGVRGYEADPGGGSQRP
jgi:hypothetical protein